MSSVWQGSRVRLRAVEPEDAPIFQEWTQDSDSARGLAYVWPPRSRIGTRKWLEKVAMEEPKNDELFLMVENINGDAVGTISTHDCRPRVGSFRYAISIAPEQRRQGYADEAIRLLLRYFFEELRYQKVTATVYSFNEPSIRLHERLGMELEGRIRRTVFTGGQHYDELFYGMTREEWEAQRDEAAS